MITHEKGTQAVGEREKRVCASKFALYVRMAVAHGY